jgi:uncharacterized membrane protein YhaH (DUF805 family)
MARPFSAKSRPVYWITILVWIFIVVAHATWRVHSILSEPSGPDLYANSASYQLVMYGVIWLPSMLLLLIAVLFAESRMFSRLPNSSVKKDGEPHPIKWTPRPND